MTDSQAGFWRHIWGTVRRQLHGACVLVLTALLWGLWAYARQEGLFDPETPTRRWRSSPAG